VQSYLIRLAGSQLMLSGSPPAAPANVSAEAASATSADVSWDASTNATGYTVERSDDAGSTWAEAGITASTSLSDTGLSAGSYLYRVVASNFWGDGPASDSSGVTVGGVNLFATSVAAAVDKADADTAQWQSFRASLDADLDAVVAGEYLFDAMPRAADYALGYHCLKTSDPTTAADYAGKAIGLALSCARDNHSGDYGAKQPLGLGDGVEADFALPGTSIVTASLVVYNHAEADPSSTSGGVVDPADYTLAGTTIAFDTPPASGRRIWAKCLYHDTAAGLRYLQTGDGGGGVAYIEASTVQMYADRYCAKTVGPVLDWCNGFSGLSSEIADELAQFLVDISDASRDFAYAPASWVESNYGAGRYVNRVFAAVALQGRHADASRLQGEVESLYVGSVNPKFGASSEDTSSLKGGFPGEGLSSYGQETTEHVLLATAALADSGWDLSPISPSSDLSAWAGEVVRFNIHATYDDAGNTGVSGETRPGSAYEGGDNSPFPCPSVSKRIYSIASGLTADDLAAEYARHLFANWAGDQVFDCWDLMFRDAAGATTDWTTDPADIGYTYTAGGRGVVFSRAAWDYASAWLSFACGNRGDSDHDEPAAGDWTLNKGGDNLLVNAAAVGGRYNSDPSGPWSNIVTVDDGGADVQTYRWSNTYVFSQFQIYDYPGVQLTAVDESNGHVFASGDYKSIYHKHSGGTNPCTTLEADLFFIPDEGYAVRYDRVTTGSAAYAKRLRLHFSGTTHPVGAGTFTLTDDGGSTNTASIAWNASAATVKSELDTLYGVTTTVEKRCDGYWIVTLPAGTHSIMTGTASEAGAVVKVYDYHPEGGSGAGTVQHVVLANTISGTQTKDVNSSRLFVRVDSADSLSSTEELVEASQWGSGDLVRRMEFYPGSVASTAFVTSLQVTTTATSSMDTVSLVTGSSTKLRGVRFGQHVLLFRVGDDFTPPDTVSVTGTGTFEWHVALGEAAAGVLFELAGAVQSTATANGSGVLYFTTTATNPSVTVAEYTPVDPTYAHSLTDVGIAADLASWYPGTGTWWCWMVTEKPDPDGSNFPHLCVTHHGYFSGSTPQNPGTRVYANTTASAGDPPSFADATTTDYAADALDIGGAGGCLLHWDMDGDGRLDMIVTATSTHPWRGWFQQSDGTLVEDTGFNLGGTSNYPLRIAPTGAGGAGLPAYVANTNLIGGSITALSQFREKTYTNTGTGFTLSDDSPIPIPAGVPSSVTDDILARCQAAVADGVSLFLDYLDLDDDGNDELVIWAFFPYDSPRNFAYYLKDVGGGTYEDKTADWGLPRAGSFIVLLEPGFLPRNQQLTNHLYHSIDSAGGAGACHVFIGGGSSTHGTVDPGMFKWTGSGFTKVTGAVTTVLATALTSGGVGDYPVHMYAVDLTNRGGGFDLVYHRSRESMAFVFLNDGSGTLTQHTSGTSAPWSHYPCWGPWGVCLSDTNDTGLLDIVLGGKNPSGAGGGGGNSTGGRTNFAVLANATTDPGSYLKVRIRRSTTQNPMGVGGTVEAYEAGQSFAPSALLRRLRCRYDGGDHHFGLGDAATVDLKVNWPDGTSSTQSGVSTNQTVTVTS
jgi:hypothetical protein